MISRSIPVAFLSILSAGGLLAVLFSAAFILQFNGLYGQDAHEYLRMARSLHEVLQQGKVMEHSYFPILYPFAGFMVSLLLQDDARSLQGISMLSLVIAFFYLKALVKVMYSETKVLPAYLLTFFFFAPYVFRFGLVSMSDMFCLLFVIAATYHGVLCLRKVHVRDAILFAALVSCAISVRYAVIILLSVPFVMVVFSLLFRKKFDTILLMIPAACMMLLPDYLLRGRILFLQQEHGKFIVDYASNAYNWSAWNFFRSGFENPDGIQSYPQWNLLAAAFNIFHPAFFFAGLVLIVFIRSIDFKSMESKMLLLMVVGYGLFLAGLHYQNNRYLLQSFPLILVLFYPAFNRMAGRFLQAPYLPGVFFSAVIVLQLFLFHYSFRSILVLNRTERTVAASLSAYPGQLVYTCSITGALVTYGVKNPVTDIYFEDIHPADSNALLLFNPVEFSQHFKGRKPMVTWQRLQDAHALQQLQILPGGWVLYAIENGNGHSSP